MPTIPTNGSQPTTTPSYGAVPDAGGSHCPSMTVPAAAEHTLQQSTSRTRAQAAAKQQARIGVGPCLRSELYQVQVYGCQPLRDVHRVLLLLRRLQRLGGWQRRFGRRCAQRRRCGHHHGRGRRGGGSGGPRRCSCRLVFAVLALIASLSLLDLQQPGMDIDP
jgi:hypothetical protein